jgi:hypothetical protein
VAIGEVKALHYRWSSALHLMAFILPIACYLLFFSLWLSVLYKIIWKYLWNSLQFQSKVVIL